MRQRQKTERPWPSSEYSRRRGGRECVTVGMGWGGGVGVGVGVGVETLEKAWKSGASSEHSEREKLNGQSNEQRNALIGQRLTICLDTALASLSSWMSWFCLLSTVKHTNNNNNNNNNTKWKQTGQNKQREKWRGDGMSVRLQDNWFLLSALLHASSCCSVRYVPVH